MNWGVISQAMYCELPFLTQTLNETTGSVFFMWHNFLLDAHMSLGYSGIIFLYCAWHVESFFLMRVRFKSKQLCMSVFSVLFLYFLRHKYCFGSASEQNQIRGRHRSPSRVGPDHFPGSQSSPNPRCPSPVLPSLPFLFFRHHIESYSRRCSVPSVNLLTPHSVRPDHNCPF